MLQLIITKIKEFFENLWGYIVIGCSAIAAWFDTLELDAVMKLFYLVSIAVLLIGLLNVIAKKTEKKIKTTPEQVVDLSQNPEKEAKELIKKYEEAKKGVIHMGTKIKNFFKTIWANKNSILAIITSVASIVAATFVALKGYIIDCGFLDFLVIPGINIGDVLVAEIPAVFAEDGVTIITEAVPAVLAEEEVLASLNVWGYVCISVITLAVIVLVIYGIINHYGWEGIEKFAERIAERKAEAEAKLTPAQRKELNDKLKVFNKGLKEVTAKIESAAAKITELKTLIDGGLATSEQIQAYNNTVAEENSLKVLEANYVAKVKEVKESLA